MFLYVIPVLVLAAILVIAASVKILREYERAVVFTLGRFQRVRGPGLLGANGADHASPLTGVPLAVSGAAA